MVTANERHDEDAMEDDDEGWQGNRRRKLWKSTCTRAALNVGYSNLSSNLTSEQMPSLASRILNAFYTHRSRRHHKPQQYSNLPVVPGKTIFGRKLA